MKRDSSRDIQSVDFSVELNASEQFVDMIKNMKSFALNDDARIKSLTHAKGTLMFDELAKHLDAHNSNFDRTVTDKEV